MIQKLPKPRKFITSALKIGIALETIAFLGAAIGWSRVNHDRDARFYLYKNHFWALDSFYKVGELLSSADRSRQLDLEYWTAEGKI